MRRHLDDHPSLTSFSGVFNSNSLSLSAANSSSNSRIFPDIDDQSGASNSNIPETVHAVGSNNSSEMQSSVHLDDHPSLTSFSGIFNSRSLPLSAPNSSCNSIIFPDINDRSGASNSNIPVTSVTACTSASLNTTFHSNRTLNVPPTSSGAASSTNKSLIQETVHAAGSNSSSEMQNSEYDVLSEMQFSLFNFQTIVDAVTRYECAESESSLGHSQSSLSGQAHSNTQIVHPLQSNSKFYVGAQMQDHQLDEIGFEGALSYVKKVKYTFGNQSEVYRDFLNILYTFTFQNDRSEVVQRVSDLFREHPELIVGFNRFTPPGYRIEVQPNEQVQISIPGTNLGGGAVSTGPTSLTSLPGGPPCTSSLLTTHSQSNHSSLDTSPHSSPGNAVNKRKTP